MSKNTILNYFSKTPKDSPTSSPGAAASGSPSTKTTPSTSTTLRSRTTTPAPASTPKGGVTPKSTTKKGNTVSNSTSTKKQTRNSVKKSASTPTTSSKKELASTPPSSRGKNVPLTPTRNSDATNKRGPSVELSPASNGRASKRIRTEGLASPGSTEFIPGALVWAKMEGYPWWPGFIRDENKSAGFVRDDGNEYHVQFFDDPPSRAWMRKSDMKIYNGSSDGSVTPAKNDPAWVKACKLADNAKPVSPKKRIEMHWFDFDSIVEKEKGSSAKKGKAKTRSESGNNNTPTKRRRIIIDSDSESVEESDVDNKQKKKGKSLNTKSDKKKVDTSKTKGEDDDEYKPDTTAETIESESEVESVEENSESEVESEDVEVLDETPPTKKKLLNKTFDETPKSASSNAGAKTTARKSNFKAKVLEYSKSPQTSTPRTPQVSAANSDDEGRWPHLKLKWLKPENIRDRKMRGIDHPEYDNRTLHVPSSYLDSLTPAVRQWWEMKSQNFDCVLFFKLGKFYEMYNMDAVCGVQELGLIFMKGEIAHCGFPETSYSRYAELLVQKGYKVARVEQTETPEMMIERCKKQCRPSKFDKVVKREICQFTSQGVRIASVQDVSGLPFQPNSEYLYALVEKQNPNGPEFGVCFIDTTIGTFHIGQFMDDRHFSRLRTLFAHYIPVEILYEKKSKGATLSAAVMLLLNNMSGVRKNSLVADTEFYSATKTMKVLAEGTYFRKTERDSIEWPKNFKLFQSEGDNLGLTPEAGWEAGIKCLGGVIFYLTKCLVEHDLLSLKQFEVYTPIDSIIPHENIKTVQKKNRSKFMVLDAVTLRNLEITFGPKNLFSLLDKCATQFGKRLLRQWTCAPLAVPEEISRRQDAIEELMTLQELRDKIVPMLKSLMDLERLLSKIHSLGSEHHSQSHPDSRAIMFEEKKYSKRKILDLTSVLKNFKSCVSLIATMKGYDHGVKSELLQTIISEFPCLDKYLEFFDNAFNHKTALEEGKIIPMTGVDHEYDAASLGIIDLQNDIDIYLRDVHKRLQRPVKYFGAEKKRFQIEIADNVRVPNDFEMSSSRKGFKRYYTAKTKEFLAKMLQLEANRDAVLKDITRRIFAQFDKHREIWKKAVNCIGTLDALLSLTTFSESQENMCRPNVISTNLDPFIRIENGRHPSLSQDNYIPNDSVLGVKEEFPGFLLLTGPNMGGKSTLMRQIGITAVLAQIGCYVPATKCDLSVVDRIFTRLGANDNIGEGESTFFVELSETSAVLQHSTPDSLVLMDELGRGTATYDGTAIAYAVAKELATRQCRSVFSTHYHTLVESLQKVPSIQLGHMACMVENENENDPTEETITFLYKLAPGACPKSYGFNAAKLAGIPDDVIRLASKKAKELEKNVKRIEMFRKVVNSIDKKMFTRQDLKLLKTV